jgi:hypothetical protein
VELVFEFALLFDRLVEPRLTDRQLPLTGFRRGVCDL